MIRYRLGRPARFLMVAAAAAWWVPSPAAAVAAPVQNTAPTAPQNLTAEALSSTTIFLRWQRPTSDGGSDITGYRIQASANGYTGWIGIGTSVTNSYTDSSRDPGTTLYYRVAATNAEGTGNPSNVVPGTTPGSTGTGTAGAPRNLTAVAAGPTVINLDWDAPSSTGGNTISGYRVDVSANVGISFTLLTNTVATEHQHSGLPVGATRHYQVRALYSDGTLGPAAYANATTAATGIGIPGVPRNLTAAAAGPTIIDLDWDAPAADGGNPITYYEVSVSADAGVSWGPPQTAVQTSYRHTGLTAGATRHYRVRARNAIGFGPWTSAVNATTDDNATPGPPRDLTADAEGSSVIELDWRAPIDAGSGPVTGYRIEWSGAGVIWDVLERNYRGTDYRDDGLSPGTTRHYRVAAVNQYGQGDWSNEASATTSSLPGRPTGLTARARGTSVIELDWTAPSGGGPVTGYRIEWSETGTRGWTLLVRNSRTTSYTHTRLSPGTTRHYRVAAINTAGQGPWSSVAQATTEVTVPGAPTSLRATLGGADQIRLTWRPPSSNGGSPITGYQIERSPNRVPWQLGHPRGAAPAAPPPPTRTPVSPPARPGSIGWPRSTPRGRGTPRTWSEGTTRAARPGQPRNLRARATGPTSITLNWEAPASDGGERITGYTIRTRGPNDGIWITIQRNTGSTATTFTDTGLQPATAYRYQVAAINRVGAGQWSFETRTGTHPDVPDAPFSLTARAVGTSRIDLSWSAPRNTGGAPILGYRVEASSNEGRTWHIIRRNTNSPSPTFSHLNLEPATTRHYRVSAINTAGTGPASNVRHATTEAARPGVPRSLSAEADGTSEIDLAWRAPTDDGGARVTGYFVEVSDDGGATWRDLVANTRNTRTTYSHTGLEPATTRHYRVSAINRIGVGEASRVESATTDATVPDAPTGLVATATTPTQIDLVWVAPDYDGGAPVTGYRIEVSETGAAWADLAPNTGSASTTYSHTGLLPGSTRFYRVSAINRVGTGEASGVASAATDDPVERAGRLNTRVLPHVAAAMTSSTVSAIAGRVDAVANGTGMERRVQTGGLSSMAASLSSPGVGASTFGRQDRSGLSSLFGGTSFQMPFGASDAPQQTSAGSQMATWGAGEYHYLGEPGSTALDWSGNMVSAHVGVDARVAPDILAGIAASYSSGTFDFTDKTGATPVTGTYGTTMTSVNPYVAWVSGERGTAVWGTAGYGWGDIEVDDLREGLRTSPARTMTGGAGGSYQLLDSGIGGVRLKGEGWAGQVMVDGGERIESVTLNMQRAKLALELKQGYRSSTGDEVGIVLEGGMRYDNGDGVNGTSAEVGGGLRYSNTRMGMIAEGRGRLLISARDGYEEWGFGGMIQLDPATRGQGLQVRLAPSYGDAASGVNQLWERGVSGAVRDHDLGAAANLDAEVAYGVAGFQGTPYSGFHLAESGARAFSSGLRYDVGSGLGLRIEGTRRESALGAAEHSVGIRGRLRFR